MYIPVNQVLLYKSGVHGGQIYIGMIMWWNMIGGIVSTSKHRHIRLNVSTYFI